MKKLTILLFAISLTSAYAQTDLKNLEWLTGKWTRTNAKPGRSGFEIWQKTSTTEMNGRGINLKGTDTTFVEKLKIIVKENAVFYVADVPQNKEPVLFKATSLTASSIVFENTQHDFPKKIAYEFDGQKLKATISGDGKAIDYWFEKSK
jgi:Domain of unknown function (DUF6265)